MIFDHSEARVVQNDGPASASARRRWRLVVIVVFLFVS
jgi:hypothetical protein